MKLTAAGLVLSLIAAAQAQPAPPATPADDYAVTRVRLYPRDGQTAALKGARFAGSITSATNDFEPIASIEGEPAQGQWVELSVPAGKAKAYRFVKLEGGNNSHLDVAEVEFYAADRKLTGTPFATTGPDEPNADAKLAFDGDTGTFFRGAATFQQYVGLDLGEGSQVAAPVLSVEQGVYPVAQTLALNTATPGAKILYSLDGWGRPHLNDKGEPGNGKWYDPAKPIQIEKSSILQAVALKPGLAPSTTTLAAYRIGAPAAGSQQKAQFHIGNSLTDTVNGRMEPIAASGGHTIRYYRFTIPGAPTDWLWDHPGTGFGEGNYAQAFIARAPLTDLITQPFSGHSRSIDNEAEFSGRFFDLARKDSPDVQMWLYVQWPGVDFSRDNWAKGKSSDLVDGTHKEVQFAEPATTWQQAAENHVRYTERVMERMNQVRADEIAAGTCKPVRIIPAALALSELKTRIEAGQVPGMTDFVATVFPKPDDIHMTAKGAYLVTLVHYACLYGESPEGKVTAAGSELTEEQARIFQQIAWEVASQYPNSGLKPATP